MAKYACPNCGSDQVQELLVGWFACNEKSLDEAQDGELRLAHMYNEVYYCEDCDTHPASLTRISKCAK